MSTLKNELLIDEKLDSPRNSKSLKEFLIKHAEEKNSGEPYYNVLASLIHVQLRPIYDYYANSNRKTRTSKSALTSLQSSIRTAFGKSQGINRTTLLDVLACLYIKLFHPEVNEMLLLDLLRSKKAFESYENNSFLKPFIAYYWKDNQVKLAELNLTLNFENEIEGGNITYYSQEQNIYTPKHNFILNINNVQKLQANLFLCFQNGRIATQISIPISSTDNFNQLTYFSYSTIDTKGYPSAGIGILESVVDFDLKKSEIETVGIDDIIINNLFQRREDIKLSESIVKAKEDIENIDEIGYFKEIAGDWYGVYLRNEKIGDDDGGIETALLTIYSSGIVELTAPKETMDGIEVYGGFASFPKPNKDFLKANFKFTSSKISSLHMFLQNEGNQILKGVYSGWTTALKPYSGLVYFTKYSNDAYRNVDFISKNDIKFRDNNAIDFINNNHFSSGLLEFFKNKDNYLNLPYNCLPKLYADYAFKETNEASFLAGKYFLYSYNDARGKILRAKLEIFRDGSVIIQKERTKFNGIATVKTMDRNVEHLFIEVYDCSEGNPSVNYWGILVLEIGSLINKYGEKTYEHIEFLPGISFRINSDNEPQSKKEYLIPCTSEEVYNNTTSYDFGYSEIGLRDLRDKAKQGNSPSIQLKKFAGGLKGKTENIMRIPTDSANNFMTTDSHRATRYDEIYFNSFLMLAIFGNPSVDSYKCREYLIESILHGLNDSTIINCLNTFTKKLNIDLAIKTELENYCNVIGATLKDLDRRGESYAKLKDLLSRKSEGSSKETIILQDTLDNLIEKLNKLIN